MSIFRITEVGTGWTGGPGYHVWYWNLVGGTSLSTGVADAAARVRAFRNAFVAQIPNTIAYTQTGVAQVIDETTGNLTGVQPYSAPAVVTGTNVNLVGAAGLATVIRGTTNTAVRGRILATRHFLGPWGANHTGSNIPASSIAGVVATAANAQLIGSILAVPVCWARPVPSGLHARAGTFASVSSYSARTSWAQLRSRRD